MVERMTNRMFAETNKLFQKDCQTANVQPTRRQASKYRRSVGAAWKSRTQKKNSIHFAINA